MNISPRENMVMAMSAVWTHRFRSGLTILGIVIGITTVVTVASLLTGLRAGVVTFFNELGPGQRLHLEEQRQSPATSSEPVKERKRRPMLPEYADVIRRFSSTVAGRRARAIHSSRFRTAQSSQLKCRDLTPTSCRSSARRLTRSI